MPGRVVRMVIRQRLAARSIKIFGTDAGSSFFFSNSRISRSSVSSLPNSFFPAYHLERQSRLTAMRIPIGLVFWPISKKEEWSNGVLEEWSAGVMAWTDEEVLLNTPTLHY